jgi:hypothetical protein
MTTLPAAPMCRAIANDPNGGCQRDAGGERDDDHEVANGAPERRVVPSSQRRTTTSTSSDTPPAIRAVRTLLVSNELTCLGPPSTSPHPDALKVSTVYQATAGCRPLSGRTSTFGSTKRELLTCGTTQRVIPAVR